MIFMSTQSTTSILTAKRKPEDFISDLFIGRAFDGSYAYYYLKKEMIIDPSNKEITIQLRSQLINHNFEVIEHCYSDDTAVKTVISEWRLLKPRHPRVSADPAPLLGQESLKSLDSRLRGNDKNLDAVLK